MKLTAPSNSEVFDVMTWLDSEPNIPENILLCLRKILAVYGSLLKGATKAKQVLHTLRQAMGIVPKSEKGAQEQLVLPELSMEAQKAVDELSAKKKEAGIQRRLYHEQLKKLLPPAKNPAQIEFELEPPGEMLFALPASERKDNGIRQKVERMREFDTNVGLRATYDTTKRMNLEIIATEITYSVETLEDINTGKKVRASMIEEGPERYQMTWKAIGNLIKMHVGFAIPMNRIALMIGQPEFSTSKMCRVFEHVAVELLPVYLVLAEQLSDVSLFSGDDTVTKILELAEPIEHSLPSRIDEHLGWAWQKANGLGIKKALNVSLLVGKTEKDPRSTIRFFRTHTGSVGNLLTRLLEWRNPRFEKLIFQGDLSSTNLPSPELREKFDLAVAGCGAHARRPFWKHREEDENLCYFMLRGFLMLSRLERRIDLQGRTKERVLKYRGRYGLRIWLALRNRCQSAISGKVTSRIPPKGNIQPKIWPPGMDLYRASQYVINHFDELTLYLKVPQLHYTNNGSERALRIEKCMLSGSKFRKTRKGRAVLDVLRTLNATCTAAKLDITEYLRYVFKNIDKMQSAPDSLTPFAVAMALQQPRSTHSRE